MFSYNNTAMMSRFSLLYYPWIISKFLKSPLHFNLQVSFQPWFCKSSLLISAGWFPKLLSTMQMIQIASKVIRNMNALRTFYSHQTALNDLVLHPCVQLIVQAFSRSQWMTGTDAIRRKDIKYSMGNDERRKEEGGRKPIYILTSFFGLFQLASV